MSNETKQPMNEHPLTLDNAYIFLVGTHFDQTSEPAMKHAISMAALRPDALVHVTHVVDDDLVANDPKALDGRRNQLVAYCGRHLMAAPAVRSRLSANLCIGPVSESLIKQAKDLRADMIVVGSHQRNGVDRILHGSIAENLIRKGPCPLLVAVDKDYPELEPSPIATRGKDNTNRTVPSSEAANTQPSWAFAM